MNSTATSEAGHSSRVTRDRNRLGPSEAAHRPTSRLDRVIVATGATYVAAWVTGLVLAPATPA
jgi:hypothetical protein